MATYNEILVGRFNRFLQKYLSMKGDAPAVQLAADWQPTIEFDAGVELRYLQSWNRYAVLQATVAQAANTSGVRLRNPSTSNVIAVIEQLAVSASVADNIDVSQGAVATDYNTIGSVV